MIGLSFAEPYRVYSKIKQVIIMLIVMGNKFLTVREENYKYEKWVDWNESCGIGLWGLKILILLPPSKFS